MDQDDLEDEVLTKTLMAHLEVFSTAFRPIYIWTYRNVPIEIVYALAVVLSLALCFAKRKGLINLEFGSNNSTQEECCEQRLADAAVFAIKGRRATMEDRFAMVQVPIPHLAENPVVRIFAIMDGHGGQYAPIYVKKHLISNLTAKIKVLKILAAKSKIHKYTILRSIDKILPGAINKPILEYIGVTLDEYKTINPQSELFKIIANNAVNNLPNNAKNNNNTSSVVMTNRVKPLEELPVKPKKNNNAKDLENSNNISGHAHSDMLSPYSNVPPRNKSQSKSPMRQDSIESNKSVGSTVVPPPKELFDYLNAKNEIIYSELLCDEISKVDETLLKAAKKDRQVGGTTLLLSILDESTLWVANVGDSRGVLRNVKGEVIPLSFDHKPSQIKEKKRIEEAGGYVSLNGVWRVQGVLATSRALGDYPLKDQKVVVSEPDVLSFEFRAKNNLPDFAILASDGLWDTHSNEEAVKNVENTLKNSDSVLYAAKQLVKDAFDKGSTDNVSVLVINLKNMLHN